MYRLTVDLLQPYLLLFLAAGVGLVVLGRHSVVRRRRLLLAACPLLGLTALSTPAVSHLALGSLEWRFPPAGRPADAEAIVVLAAGVAPPDAVRGQPEMDEDTLRRCLHAADLYHQGGPCPVLVSGGNVDPEEECPPYAEVMASFLGRLGVRPGDLVIEGRSRTTYENAVQCRQVLEERHLRKVVLVTDAVDMYRALACFRRQGVEATPSACHYRATEFRWAPLAFLPSPAAAWACQRVWHEWLGVAWYHLQGRM